MGTRSCMGTEVRNMITKKLWSNLNIDVSITY